MRKVIPGFEDYSVDEYGNVFRETPNSRNEYGHKLKPATDRYGYKYVAVSNGEKIIKKKVHHLVLMAHDRLPKDGEQCRHLNGFAHDNCIGNLMWGYAQENSDDQIKHGTRMNGERHHNNRLKKCEAEEVYRLSHSGVVNQEYIAKMFMIAPETVSSIKNKRIWKCLHA